MIYNEDGQVRRICAVMTKRGKSSVFQTISANDTDEQVKSIDNDWHEKTKPSVRLVNETKTCARSHQNNNRQGQSYKCECRSIK